MRELYTNLNGMGWGRPYQFPFFRPQTPHFPTLCYAAFTLRRAENSQTYHRCLGLKW